MASRGPIWTWQINIPASGSWLDVPIFRPGCLAQKHRKNQMCLDLIFCFQVCGTEKESDWRVLSASKGKDPSRDSQMAIVSKVQGGLFFSWWQALFLTADRGGACACQSRLALFLKGILINIIFEGLLFKFSIYFSTGIRFPLGSKDPGHCI